MIDIIEAINVLELHGMLRPVNQLQNWYRCYCPLHSGGNERKPSFGISIHDQYTNGTHYPVGTYHCFACGASGNIEKLVTEILKSKGISGTGREWLSENVPSYDPESEIENLIPDDMMNTLVSKYAVDYIRRATQPEVNYVSEEELASYRYTVPYMYERKLTDEIIEKYDVGYDGNWIPPGKKRPVPCITFPIRDKEGRTLFLCRRSIAGKLYNYPEGVTKPVFGIDMIPAGTKSVIICESCINALTLVSYGYSAVALLGTGNPYQIQQLKELGVNEFVLCMDGDEAGRKASARLKRSLSSVAIVWTIHMPDGKDANDCSKEEFQILYDSRD